nr:YdeI/OmpD-associated family protein [Lewinella sp. W8]
MAEAPDHWRPQLIKIREIMLSFDDLEEAIKWAFPVYSLGKKNVAGLFHTKQYVGVWFMQGALLPDPNERLVNASPGKTVSQRQLRFGPGEAVDEELVRTFMAQAVENQAMGLKMKPAPAPEVPMPAELREALASQPALAAAYEKLTPGRQRDYCEYIGSAKRAATRASRLEKSLGLIAEGKGLNDQYRK